MSLPKIATREEWLAARKDLLAKEKDLARQRDALSTERRNLPMVEIEKNCTFDSPNGTVRVIDIFENRRQLIIYHFMFHPEWQDGCPSCTAGIDEVSPGFLDHLHTRDTTFRWCLGRRWTSMKTSEQPYDMPGRSCFLQVDGRVFHTYSQYARGLESTGGSYYFLDLTALGRARGLGGAEGAYRSGKIRHAGLRVVTVVKVPDDGQDRLQEDARLLPGQKAADPYRRRARPAVPDD